MSPLRYCEPNNDLRTMTQYNITHRTVVFMKIRQLKPSRIQVNAPSSLSASSVSLPYTFSAVPRVLLKIAYFFLAYRG